jgi:aspartate dehydrogenase
MIKVAIIGCGNIGTELALFLNKDKRFFLVAIDDINPKNFFHLCRKLRRKFPLLTIEDAIKKADLVIEAADKETVKEILECKALDLPGKQLLVMSTGGLAENFRLMKKIRHCRIHIPSGAIAGLDAIQAVRGNIKSLTLTSTKPFAGLKNSPHVLLNKINLNDIKTSEKIFEGNLNEAIEGFPQNINVAASLFLASNFRRLKISVIADAKTKYNSHEIHCIGSFGEIHTTTKNLPSKNPKTSYLAILSAISVMKTIASKISIGS